MTRQQRRALLYLQDSQDRGESPTFDDVRAHLGLRSKSGVSRLMNVLRALGHVRNLRYKRRSYEVIRRIDPIVEHYVFCPQFKTLVLIDRFAEDKNVSTGT